MREFWEYVIEPLLDASGARTVVEVGTGAGDTTALLLEWGERTGAVVHSIDPVPGIDVTGWQREHGERFRFHQARSLDVLGEIGGIDAVLLDGDHNWYTVNRELHLLADLADAEGSPLPLIMAHDVGWPYGRRDLYYDPESVPAEYRHEAAQAGIHPGTSELATPGFNPHLVNAAHEGGERNGVLTGIEDFIDDRAGPCEFFTIPGAGGIAVLADRRRLEGSTALREAIERVRTPETLRVHLAAVDELRVVTEIRLRKAQAENGRLASRGDELQTRLATTTEELATVAERLAQSREIHAAEREMHSQWAQAARAIGRSRTWRIGDLLARGLRLLTLRRPVPSEGPAQLAERIESQSRLTPPPPVPPAPRRRRPEPGAPSAARPRIELPEGLERERVEEVAREFTRVYRELKEQTFKATTWLGVPLVKTPSEIVAVQEIVVETQPELVVETGVHRGGGTLLYASLLELLGIEGRVIAIDVDVSRVDASVREHPRVELVEGSSTDPRVVDRVRAAAEGRRVMVDLDSDHAGDHVLAELRTYAAHVAPGCYLIVEDTFVGGRPVLPELVPGPMEALDAWLAEDDPPFEIDRWPERFLLTQSPRGYLRRVDPDNPMPPRPDGFVIGALEEA